MLTPEEYRAFEQAQKQKFENADTAPSMNNYEHWQVTRYNNNLHRYFVTAKKEFGTQFKQYADIGFWQGGVEHENRMFEELQYFYRNTQSVSVRRTMVNANCKLFEIRQEGSPLQLIMIIDGKTVYTSDPHKIKDGYRYRLKRLEKS